MSGSSKKRKYKEMEEEVLHADYRIPEDDLHTPVPDFSGNARGMGRKRRCFEAADEVIFKKFRGNRDKEVRKSRELRWNDGRKNQQHYQGNVANVGEVGGQKRGGKQQARGGGNRKQQNREFKPFDYSSVDYRQFQGGGRSVAGAGNVKKSRKNTVGSCRFGCNSL